MANVFARSAEGLDRPAVKAGVIGASIVVFNRKTNIVVDIMADVVR